MHESHRRATEAELERPPTSGCTRGRRRPARSRRLAWIELAKRERPDGLRLWTFASNLRAQRFYERHGFVEAQRTDGRGNEERAPDILYVWAGTP
jgi:GNAT superfamily N-acetyltransferase